MFLTNSEDAFLGGCHNRGDQLTASSIMAVVTKWRPVLCLYGRKYCIIFPIYRQIDWREDFSFEQFLNRQIDFRSTQSYRQTGDDSVFLSRVTDMFTERYTNRRRFCLFPRAKDIQAWRGLDLLNSPELQLDIEMILFFYLEIYRRISREFHMFKQAFA